VKRPVLDRLRRAARRRRARRFAIQAILRFNRVVVRARARRHRVVVVVPLCRASRVVVVERVDRAARRHRASRERARRRAFDSPETFAPVTRARVRRRHRSRVVAAVSLFFRSARARVDRSIEPDRRDPNRSNRSNRSIRASNRIDLEVALGEVDLGVLESGIGNFPMRIEIGDFTLFAHTKSLIRRYANTASARIDTS